MIAHAIDIILALVLVEAVALVALRRVTGQGLPPRELLATLAAGFFLTLALRLVLAGAGEAPIGACLLASLIAHIADLAGRWRR